LKKYDIEGAGGGGILWAKRITKREIEMPGIFDNRLARRFTMKAFEEICHGANLTASVADRQDYGRNTRVEKALAYSERLVEPFNDDEFEVVQEAYRRFRIVPPSRSPHECSMAMLKLLAS
jgi:hypothetical protein